MSQAKHRLYQLSAHSLQPREQHPVHDVQEYARFYHFQKSRHKLAKQHHLDTQKYGQPLDLQEPAEQYQRRS